MSKGSGRRPQQVSEEEMVSRWLRTFGYRNQPNDESPSWVRLGGFQPPRDEQLERFRQTIDPRRAER